MEVIRTINGYTIYLNQFDREIIKKIKKELTIVIKNDNFNSFFEIYNYREYKNYIILPIYYVNNSKYFENKVVNIKRPKSLNCEFEFKGILKEYQYEAYEALKNHIFSNNTGIFCLETGYGKTFLSLKLMSEIKKKTLIISASVNQTDLLHQWKESILKFIESPSIGILQGKNIDVDKDIILTTIKSLSQINYSEEFFKGIGFVIIDECFIGFFANLNTEENITKLYLWEFFLELFNNQKVTKVKFDAWKSNPNGLAVPQEAITIKENTE